jgi:hypothetical protein
VAGPELAGPMEVKIVSALPVEPFTDHIRRCRTRSGGLTDYHEDAVDDKLLPCHKLACSTSPEPGCEGGAFSWMMEPAALVSALGVHGTPDEKRGETQGVQWSRRPAWCLCYLVTSFPIFSLLRVRLQFGISVVPRRSLYVGISRCSVHAAPPCMRTKDEMWMCCWPLKPYATLGVSTSPHHPHVAARVWGWEALEAPAGKERAGQVQGPRSKPLHHVTTHD